MQCSRHPVIRKVTGMLSVLTVIAYSEPLSVLSRRARNSSRSITPFLHTGRLIKTCDSAQRLGIYSILLS